MMNIALIAVLVVASLLGSTIIIQFVASFRRRGGDLPPDLLDGDLPKDDAASGVYLGTFREGWKKPLDPNGLLRKGPGKFWVDDKGVNFLVNHAFQPVFLPFARVFDANIEQIAMRKHRGESALIVHWKLDDVAWRSAFLVDKADYNALIKQIKEAMQSPSETN